MAFIPLSSGTTIEESIETSNFKYLTKMPMDNVTTENIENILNEKNQMELDYKTLQSKSEKSMWLDELDTFEKKYQEYLIQRSPPPETKIKSTKPPPMKLVMKRKFEET